MRLAFIVLLVALFATVDVAVGSPDLARLARLLTAQNPNIPASRRLRTDETTDDEERVMKIPGNSKLAKLLNSRGTTVSVADKFRAKSWVAKKDSVDDVFTRLKLDSGVEKVMSNPKIKAWETYIDLYNKKYTNEQVTMAGLLVKKYGDLPVAKMLQSSKLAKPESLAKRLRYEQQTAWKTGGKSAGDVFKLLELDKAGYNLFVSPQFNTWYNYMGMLDKKHPERSIVKILAAQYGDDGLVTIFIAAETKVMRMRFLAQRLETAMGQRWLAKNLSPDDVFKMLKLDADVDTLLTNPTLKTWMGYLTYFNLKKPEEATTRMQTFVNSYGYNSMSKMLNSAQKVEGKETLETKLLSELNTEKLRVTREVINLYGY